MALPCKIKVKSEKRLCIRRTLCVQKPFGQKKPSASDDLFCLNPCEALLKNIVFLLRNFFTLHS